MDEKLTGGDLQMQIDALREEHAAVSWYQLEVKNRITDLVDRQEIWKASQRPTVTPSPVDVPLIVAYDDLSAGFTYPDGTLSYYGGVMYVCSGDEWWAL